MFSTQISAICQSLPTSHIFIYGTANEVNNKADKQDSPDDLYICLFPLSPITIELVKAGGAANEFDMYIEFLYKTKFERTSADNEQLTANALYFANLFLVKLREYVQYDGQPKFFKWKDSDRATARPVYNKYDVNTAGISLSFKARLMSPPMGAIC